VYQGPVRPGASRIVSRIRTKPTVARPKAFSDEPDITYLKGRSYLHGEWKEGIFAFGDDEYSAGGQIIRGENTPRDVEGICVC
jgi:hypothetical protein